MALAVFAKDMECTFDPAGPRRSPAEVKILHQIGSLAHSFSVRFDVEGKTTNILPPIERIFEEPRDRRPACLISFAEISLYGLRRDLSNGVLPTEIVNTDGKRIPVPVYFWNSIPAEDVLWRDWPACFDHNGDGVGGQVIVSTKALERYMTYEVEAALKTSAEVAEFLPKPKEIEHSEQTEAYDICKDNSVSLEDLELPPYLKLMLKVSRSPEFKANRHAPKKVIEALIEANWPADLPRSGVKLSKMATFMREPEAEKGGNLPKVNSKTQT